jgi:chromate transporter
MLAGGRVGAILAGLGFMLPGFVLMFALSWFYVTAGVTSPAFAAVFQGMQPAVGALIVRAIHRIGQHALTDRWLWGIALFAGLSVWLGAHFILALAASGVTYVFARQRPWAAIALAVVFVTAALLTFSSAGIAAPIDTSVPASVSPVESPSTIGLLGSGLRSGLLTFGGAYTAIPFLRYDAVQVGRWMSDSQFLDGLALSGILPAPLIIFSTFVGYLGGGPIAR